MTLYLFCNVIYMFMSFRIFAFIKIISTTIISTSDPSLSYPSMITTMLLVPFKCKSQSEETQTTYSSNASVFNLRTKRKNRPSHIAHNLKSMLTEKGWKQCLEITASLSSCVTVCVCVCVIAYRLMRDCVLMCDCVCVCVLITAHIALFWFSWVIKNRTEKGTVSFTKGTQSSNWRLFFQKIIEFLCGKN